MQDKEKVNYRVNSGCWNCRHSIGDTWDEMACNRDGVMPVLPDGPLGHTDYTATTKKFCAWLKKYACEIGATCDRWES